MCVLLFFFVSLAFLFYVLPGLNTGTREIFFFFPTLREKKEIIISFELDALIVSSDNKNSLLAKRRDSHFMCATLQSFSDSNFRSRILKEQIRVEKNAWHDVFFLMYDWKFFDHFRLYQFKICINWEKKVENIIDNKYKQIKF